MSISSLTPSSPPCSSSPESSSSSPSSTQQIRLHFAGRDLPEPDSRSRITYAVVYYAEESLLSQHSHITPSDSLPSSILLSSSTHPSFKQSSLIKNLIRRILRKDSELRAPHVAEPIVASTHPQTIVTDHGEKVSRSAWLKLGQTELARKNGRDIEFAKSFQFLYRPSVEQVLRVAFYDCTSRKEDEQRLIGVAEVKVKHMIKNQGKRVNAKLKFLPVSERDVKKSGRVLDGTLVCVAQVEKGERFRLDVECNAIHRTKSLGNVLVKRVFYCIHGVLNDERDNDEWTLLFRSKPVGMIHKKRDGGSLEYNYFTSRRLIAGPGVIIEDKEEEDGWTGWLGRRKEMFFSLPGGDLSVHETMRLKLGVFEDMGVVGGFDLIAETEFCFEQLREQHLGGSSVMKLHGNVVGKALLKYVECKPIPQYFCLALRLQGVR